MEVNNHIKFCFALCKVPFPGEGFRERSNFGMQDYICITN